MKNLWNDQQATKYQGDLALRVYTSKLLGQNPSLVLHGGGNTSVKIKERNLVGEIEEILYVSRNIFRKIIENKNSPAESGLPSFLMP